MANASVYIWGNYESTGHVSVGLDKDYLSFHPKNNSWNLGDISGKPGYLGQSYSEDYHNHGRPVAEFHINWLDTEAMYRKINHYSELEHRGSLIYNLVTSNCSTLAIELLCCGAHEDFHPFKSLGRLFGVYKNRIFNKEDHHRFLESARDLMEEYLIRCPKGNFKGSMSRYFLPLLTADFISREFIYSPGDVAVFANELREANH